MPALDTSAIRTAITEVMEGSIGSGRLTTDLLGLFRAGVFADAQPRQATAAKLRRGGHWFDVSIARHSISRSKGVQNVELHVTITVYTQLAPAAQVDDRKTQRDQLEEDLDLACQTLGLPRVLETTVAGTATNIVGGLMLGPSYTGVPEFVVSEERAENRLRADVSGVLFVNAGGGA